MTLQTRTFPRVNHERVWIGALATFGVGDVATTVAFLLVGANFEGHPLAATMIDGYGLAALIPLKIVAFVLFYILYRFVPDDICVGVPLGLLLLGSVITVWNIYSSVFGVRILL
jgi:uncharacterized BrkB/YihY/UPF0761 family membrane protein